MFTEDRALFMPHFLGSNEILRSMNTDYGIIPFPKWNEEQPGYYSASQNSYSIFGIPVTCEKTDAVGATMEAMCAESYRTVTPAYYEIALKQKYARDEETAQMLDIIRDGIKFDFGMANGINLDNMPVTLFRNLLMNNNRNFTSFYNAQEARYQRLLDTLLDAYENLY